MKKANIKTNIKTNKKMTGALLLGIGAIAISPNVAHAAEEVQDVPQEENNVQIQDVQTSEQPVQEVVETSEVPVQQEVAQPAETVESVGNEAVTSNQQQEPTIELVSSNDEEDVYRVVDPNGTTNVEDVVNKVVEAAPEGSEVHVKVKEEITETHEETTKTTTECEKPDEKPDKKPDEKPVEKPETNKNENSNNATGGNSTTTTTTTTTAESTAKNDTKVDSKTDGTNTNTNTITNTFNPVNNIKIDIGGLKAEEANKGNGKSGKTEKEEKKDENFKTTKTTTIGSGKGSGTSSTSYRQGPAPTVSVERKVVNKRVAAGNPKTGVGVSMELIGTVLGATAFALGQTQTRKKEYK